MNTDIIIGLAAGLCSVVIMSTLALVSCVRIERIARNGFGTGRETLKDLNGGR